MNFFTGIRNFIRTEILGIEEINTPVSTEKKENNPVIECEVEKPVDKFENSGSKEEKQTNLNRRALEDTLRNIPAKYIDINKLLKEGLLEKVTCLSPEMFDKLPQEKKNLVINTVKYSIARLESMKEAGKIDKTANIENLVIAFASNFYQAVMDGDFKDIASLEKAAGDVVNNLGKDFDSCTSAEQKNRLKNERIDANKELDEELKKLDNVPEKERPALKRRILRRHRFIMRKRFLDITARKKSETAADAIILLNSEDMEYGAKTVIATRSCKEEQVKVADYADYNFTKELIKNYHEMGDSVSADTLKGYTQTFMEYKSAAAAKEYQNSYTADRAKYENARRKQQNGESLTPEEESLLNTMSAEYYTATAQGIGEGALNNVNMTPEEKAVFISEWQDDAKQFDDYERVVSKVTKEIENNPAYENIRIEKQKIEKAAGKNKEIKIVNKSAESYIPEKSSVSTEIYSEKTGTGEIHEEDKKYNIKEYKQEMTSAKEQNPANNNYVTPVTTAPSEIARKIKDEGVEKAVKKYGSDAIELILDYAGFKHLRSQLTTIIRSYDFKTLTDITTNCSDSSYVFICRIVNKDYVDRLAENRERTKGLCYIAKKQVQKLEGAYA